MKSLFKQVLAVFLGVSLFAVVGCGVMLGVFGYVARQEEIKREEQRKQYYESLKNGDLPGFPAN
jgi:preprotein translocase subunit YajC